MKKLLLSAAAVLGIGLSVLSQCPIGTPYQSGNAPSVGGSVTLTTCAYAGEYQTISGVVINNEYTVTYTGGSGNFITVYDATQNAVASGVSPITFVAQSNGTYYSQANVNSTCGTDFSCHTGVWSNTTPPGCTIGTPYQTGTAPAAGANVNITTCAYAGEYQTINGVVPGDQYTVTYTGGSSNYVTVYDAFQIEVIAGVSPVTFTATVGGTYYSQANLNDGNCSTDFSCHTANWANTSPPPACPPEVAPWLETFTGSSNPTCWTQSSTSGGPWTYTGNPGYDVSGTLDHTNGVSNNYAWVDHSGTDAGVILTTPEIDVTALGGNVALRFWTVSHYLGTLDDYNSIFVEASDGAGNWSLVQEITGETGPDWVENILDISSYIYGANLVQVRFRAEDGSPTSGFAFYNDQLLDDVQIFDPSSFCFDPFDFVSTGATGTTADFTWDINTLASTSDYIIEYGPIGFTPGTFTNVVNVTGATTGQVTGLTAGNIYDYYVYSSCGADTSNFAGPVTLVAECAGATALTLDAADNVSADISWTSSGTEFIVEYDNLGFTLGSGITQIVTPTSANLTGLTPNSFYEAYVRVICGPGDTSAYLGPLEFNTYNQGLYMDYNSECAPNGFIDISNTGTATNLGDDAELNLTLDFPMLYQGTLYTDVTIAENGAVLFGTNQNLGFSNGLIANQVDGIFGFWDDVISNNGNIWYQTIGTAPNRQFIVQTKSEYWSGGSGDFIEYQLIFDEATFEVFAVYEDVTFGNFADFGASATIGAAGPNQDLQVSYNNTNYLTNNSCIRYFYTNCPNVVDLATVGYFTDTIIVSWNAGLDGETNWTIEYGPAGFTPGTGTTFTTTNTQDTISGLTQLTDYDVYVYSDCDLTLQSVGAVITTQTAPVCATPFGVTASGLQDSITVTWDWTVGAPTSLPTGFNIQYMTQGQPLYSGTTVSSDIIFDDTIVDAGLLYGAYYDVYVQAVCGADTSLYAGPASALIPALNDSTCFAVDLATDGTVYQFNNLNTGVSPGEAAIAPPATGFNTPDGWGNSTLVETTWFTFTAPASGNLLISGKDNNQTTKMAVYEVTDCGDYNTFTLVGANDDDIEVPFQNAPLYIQCGLTPGAQYYLLHSNEFTFTQNNYSIALTEIDFNAGSFVSDLDACIGDTVDMFNTITGYDVEYGTWLENQFTAQLNDEFFATTVLAPNTYAFEYRVERQCAYDSITSNVTIFPLSSAGQDGSATVCLNEPINLFDALNGVVNFGGIWYDPQDAALIGATPSASSIPGQFNYDYIVGNGVCPDDTSLVVITVDGTCDYLGLDEDKLEGITIFPNPTSDIVTLASENSEVLKVQITDIKGRVVYTSNEKLTFGTELVINVEAFEKGIYMINLRNEKVTNTYRLVKN